MIKAQKKKKKEITLIKKKSLKMRSIIIEIVNVLIRE